MFLTSAIIVLMDHPEFLLLFWLLSPVQWKILHHRFGRSLLYVDCWQMQDTPAVGDGWRLFQNDSLACCFSLIERCFNSPTPIGEAVLYRFGFLP